jgi:hypothetical protein
MLSRILAAVRSAIYRLLSARAEVLYGRGKDKKISS